jgi:hypothetical protein
MEGGKMDVSKRETIITVTFTMDEWCLLVASLGCTTPQMRRRWFEGEGMIEPETDANFLYVAMRKQF